MPSDKTFGIQEYLSQLLTNAQTQYPYLKKHNLQVEVGKGKGYAETWIPGDPGSKNSPRDPRVPVDRAGVTVYKPDKFQASDLAAEGLHLDPVSKMIRQHLLASLTPEQIGHIQHSGDYTQSIDEGMKPDAAMNNGVDAAMRGILFSQWPQEANDGMKYDPAQKGLLDTLLHYLTSGHQ